MDNLPRNHFRAILADPPWAFQTWAGAQLSGDRRPCAATKPHYQTMTMDDIAALPVKDVAADDCLLFMWISWPILEHALRIIGTWGFVYKTCGFCWVKANARQIEMFREDIEPRMNLGYWTRSNSEVCLLGTRGCPTRVDGGVRQVFIEPAREHSRKPDGIYERIERLVEGPYLELFARTERPGWTSWGNEVGKFKHAGSAGMDLQT